MVLALLICSTMFVNGISLKRYVAPEVMSRELRMEGYDVQADIYSFGI